MADIFISYSKKDIEQVRLLDAYLQAAGYTVWWDKELFAGEVFTDTIDRQLELARAVIVLWTENSVRSTFVHAEALKAQFHEKLVPVRAGSISYEDIRTPFNALHTDDISAKTNILSAINQRIIAPKSSSYQWARWRYKLLLGWGVLGSALTVFSSMGAFVELANWAKALAYFWFSWAHAFWSNLAQLIGLEFPVFATGFYTVALFLISTVAASRLSAKRSAAPLLTGAGLLKFLAGVVLCFASTMFVRYYLDFSPYEKLNGLTSTYAPTLQNWFAPHGLAKSAAKYNLGSLFDTTIKAGIPLSIMLFAFNFRTREIRPLLAKCIVSGYILAAIVSLIMEVSRVRSLDLDGGYRPDTLLGELAPAVLVVSVLCGPVLAPVNAIHQRLLYVAGGVFFFFALNWLSSLGIDISAPPVPAATG